MIKIQKRYFVILTILLFSLTIFFKHIPVTALEKINETTYTYPFNSGYCTYENSMTYKVISYKDGSLKITGNANQKYLPEDLDGDYIKFCSINYDTTKVDFIFDTAINITGQFYTEDTYFNNGMKTVTIWCKHAVWGLLEGYVFDFELKPKSSGIDSSVNIFDTTIYMVDMTNIPTIPDPILPDPVIPEMPSETEPAVTNPPIPSKVETSSTTITNPPSPAKVETKTTTKAKTPETTTRTRPTIYPETIYNTIQTITTTTTETTTETIIEASPKTQSYIIDCTGDSKFTWLDVVQMINSLF